MEQISAWQEFAQHNEIILVAPTLPAGEAIEPKIPDLLHGLMEEAKQQVAIDPRRIYLFGHSAGGFFTFDAAMLDSKYYAAAAVHAAAIDPDYDWIMKRASRKIPIALYIGDSDPTCSFARSRRTRDNLLAQDFPLHYVEMPRHDHNYYAVSDQVNRDAWKFLSQYSLPK